MSGCKPILRYHGGKALLAPWIIDHFPPHRTYVEPFGGGASVLLAKPRAPYREVYNDLDGEIVNLFRVVRDPARCAELERLLRLTPYARAEFADSYEASDDPVEQARRTVARSYMGFGSAAASGHKTGFRRGSTRNGSDVARDWMRYPARLAAVCDRMQGVTIDNLPAAEVIAREDRADTLHYVDPPYVHATRRQGNPCCKKQYRHEMTDADHEALAEALRGCVGMVVLSGYPCALYDRLFGDWPRVERAALADGARARTECLWLNPAAWEARQGARGLLDFGVPGLAAGAAGEEGAA